VVSLLSFRGGVERLEIVTGDHYRQFGLVPAFHVLGDGKMAIPEQVLAYSAQSDFTDEALHEPVLIVLG
jgi:hypothetical protein